MTEIMPENFLPKGFTVFFTTRLLSFKEAAAEPIFFYYYLTINTALKSCKLYSCEPRSIFVSPTTI